MERFNPQRIMLFGPQARGMTDYYNDVDLLVVIDNSTGTRCTAVEMRRVLKDLTHSKGCSSHDAGKNHTIHGDMCGNVWYYALCEEVTLYERDGTPTNEAFRWT